jgi:hypothetical protein
MSDKNSSENALLGTPLSQKETSEMKQIVSSA